MLPIPSLSFGSSSSAKSGVEGDTSQGSQGGAGTGNRGFSNNFAGIGGRVAAGDPSTNIWLAVGALVLAALVAFWAMRK